MLTGEFLGMIFGVVLTAFVFAMLEIFWLGRLRSAEPERHEGLPCERCEAEFAEAMERRRELEP